MSATIEEHVAILEKALTRLKHIIQGTRVEKDWRKHLACLPTTRGSMT